MSFWDVTRGTTSVRLLVDFGRENGLSSVKLLTGTKLSLAQLADPNVEISAAQELRVVSNLLRPLKAPHGLGLQVGMRYHYSVYGLWGYGLISSATGADALALALRFLSLTYAFTLITYHEEGPLGVLSFGEPELPDETRRFLVERDMSAAAVLLRELCGERFSLARFVMRADHKLSNTNSNLKSRSIFGTDQEFGGRVNNLAFQLALLNQPLPQANPITVAMCEQMCCQLIERRRARLGTVPMIQQYLNAAPGGMQPDLEWIARLTNTSSRTLKRRLLAEGTTFRALLAQSRSALAKELLQDEKLTLTDVAEQLGFSDLSSFSQAFKRWYGIAPSVFRVSTASVEICD